MAKAETQQRWREGTAKKRVEAYLPAAAVERLDEIARRRGERRPAALAALIESADMPAEPHAKPTPAVSDLAPASTLPSPPEYRLRKARTAAEKRRYSWMVETDEGTVCGLQRNPGYGAKWRGEYLAISITKAWAKANSRDAVARMLLESPVLYQ